MSVPWFLWKKKTYDAFDFSYFDFMHYLSYHGAACCCGIQLLQAKLLTSKPKTEFAFFFEWKLIGIAFKSIVFTLGSLRSLEIRSSELL